MSFIDQHCYIATTFAKQVLALSLAVNAAAIPLSLFFFGKFPLASLLYNLIIPFFVSGIMFLFIAGIFIPWLHSINHLFTQITLDSVNNLPAPLHIHFYYPLELKQMICWLTISILIGVGYRYRSNSPDFFF